MTGDFGLIGCVLDVMLETEMACSGRRSCKMHVNDVTFKIANPCHKEFKNHLWVGYRCLPGMKWCGVVWCGVVWCGVVWCGVGWCGVVVCGMVWCEVVWYGVV